MLIQRSERRFYVSSLDRSGVDNDEDDDDDEDEDEADLEDDVVEASCFRRVDFIFIDLIHT